MINLQLFFEFFKIGMFAIGGGLATLPFLYHLSEKTGWFPPSLITDIIAISGFAPGPIGLNIATFVGYSVAGVPGGIIAASGEVLPCIIIVTAVSKSLERFKNTSVFDHAFYGIRPAVTALIAAAGFDLFKTSVFSYQEFLTSRVFYDLFDWKKLVIFIAIVIGIKKLNKHPVVYIAFAAAAGILFSL